MHSVLTNTCIEQGLSFLQTTLQGLEMQTIICKYALQTLRMKKINKVNEERWHPLTMSYGIQDLAIAPGGFLQMSVAFAHINWSFFPAGGGVNSTLDYRNYSRAVSGLHCDLTVSLANLHESFSNKGT